LTPNPSTTGPSPPNPSHTPNPGTGISLTPNPSTTGPSPPNPVHIGTPDRHHPPPPIDNPNHVPTPNDHPGLPPDHQRTPNPSHSGHPTPHPTPPPTVNPNLNCTDNPPCYNDGKYCNGNGICVNCKCQCEKTCTAIDCDPASCNPPSCIDLKVSNCSTCQELATASGLLCVWCPNSTEQRSLTVGVCVEDYLCPSNPIVRCTPPVDVLIDDCPDNCTHHGICINKSLCKSIEGKKQPDGKIYTCAPSANRTNVTRVCACLHNYKGLNCAIVAGAGLLAPLLTAGIIAAIIIAVLFGLMLAGGGAVAATNAFATENLTSVHNNPLYKPSAVNAENPLYGMPQ